MEEARLVHSALGQQRKGLFVWILEWLRKLHIRSRYLEAKRERLMAAIGLLPMLRLRAGPQVKGGAAAVPISNPPAESS